MCYRTVKGLPTSKGPKCGQVAVLIVPNRVHDADLLTLPRPEDTDLFTPNQP